MPEPFTVPPYLRWQQFLHEFQTAVGAEKLATSQEAVDDWSYRVVPNPTGRKTFLVAVFDEAGQFVGYL